MNAGKQSINGIFNGNRILRIPYFQRSYVWNEEQWERMLHDIEEVSAGQSPYFMGSVILKQENTPLGSMVGDIRTIIDGQQRLTTLCVFFKVLGLKYNQDNITKRVFWTMSGQLALEHNRNDIASFTHIMNLTSLDDLPDESDRIFQCYNYFKRNIKNTLNYHNILNQIVLIGIEVDAQENEQQIFDTINSLGVSLTTAELLKNYLFNRDEDAYMKFWYPVFEVDKETKDYWDKTIVTGRFRRTLIDIFFYSFLQIKIQEKQVGGGNVSTVDKDEFSRVENLYESYKKYITNYHVDLQNLLDEIKAYASVFHNTFDPSILEQELPKDAGIERINALIFGMDNSTIIPYVLYIMKHQQNIVERNLLFEYIESYIIRRIIVRATNKNYNQFFTEQCIGKSFLSKNDLKNNIEQVQNNTVNYLPNDQEVTIELSTRVYTNHTAANLLYFIESKLRDRSKQSTQLLGMTKYSLEHLMPKKWRNHWQMPLTKEDQENRDRVLKTIGNLTIITQPLNSSIRDSEWQVKLTGRNGKDGLIKYASGIEITSNVLNCSNWDENEIVKRTNYLDNLIKTYWPS